MPPSFPGKRHEFHFPLFEDLILTVTTQGNAQINFNTDSERKLRLGLMNVYIFLGGDGAVWMRGRDDGRDAAPSAAAPQRPRKECAPPGEQRERAKENAQPQ